MNSENNDDYPLTPPSNSNDDMDTESAGANPGFGSTKGYVTEPYSYHSRADFQDTI